MTVSSFVIELHAARNATLSLASSVNLTASAVDEISTLTLSEEKSLFANSAAMPGSSAWMVARYLSLP